CIVALLVGILLLLNGWSRLKYRRFQAWECEQGFLEFDERGAVTAALRWDHIQTIWHRVKISSTAQGGTSHFHTYAVQGPGGKEVILNYPDLWQRIEYEFVRLHFQEALATIHAGSNVSFGCVVVSAQGIASAPANAALKKALPNPTLPWQFIW